MKRFFTHLIFSAACGCVWFSGGAMISKCSAQDRSPIAKAATVDNYEVINLEETSLKFVEPDAAFYSASFQMDKQWDAFINGPFAQHLLNAPITKSYQAAFMEQWNSRKGQIGELRRNIENPNIKSVIDLVLDMSGDEVFLYGDSSFPTSLMALNQLVQELQTVVATDPQSLNEYVMSLQSEDIDAIVVPTLMFGGKVSNKDLALQQIDILEAIITLAINQVPQLAPLQESLKRVEGESGTRLTLTLTADMIPWDQMAQNPDVSELVSKAELLLHDREISLSIGMFNDYFIVAITESAEDIDALNEVEESILDSDEFELVRSKAQLPVLGIGYASDAMADANFQMNLQDYFSKNFGRIIAPIQSTISSQMNFTEDEDELEKLESILDLLDSLPDELEWLDEQIGQHVPDFKGQTSVAVGHADGIESWVESRMEPVALEYSESLPVLQHLGGNPIGFVALKSQHHPEYFETARLIVRKVKSYLDRLVVSGVLDEDDEMKLDLVLQKAWPILVEFADTIEQDFIPATADGQFALVINEPQIVAKQWFKDMPPSDSDLPLIEIGEIWGVSDSEKLINGYERLYKVFDQVVDFVREQDENAIPEGYTVPRPESRDNPVGKNYFYKIPDECPVPETMALQALFTEDFAYYTYSDPQIKQLAKTTPLATRADFIAAEENLGSVAYIDFGRFFGGFKPWVLYGANLAPEDVIIPGQDGFPEIRKSDILELLGAFEKCGELISVDSGNDTGSTSHSRYFR